jgi:hypothetical protein
MLAEYTQTDKKLYDTNHHLWVLMTIEKLEQRQFDSLDLQNLIEEISDLSRRDKRKLECLLTLIFEHLLKLKYWSSERGRNQADWEAEILNFRKQLQRELKASPSLKSYLVEIFDECYQDGREIAATRSRIALDTFPQEAIANLEQVLDQNWLPSLVD